MQGCVGVVTAAETQENRSAVISAYQALGAGDPGGFLKPLAGNVEWIEAAGFELTGGVYVGVEAVVTEVLGPFTAAVRDLKVTPIRAFAEADSVVVIGRYQGENVSGAPIDVPFVHTWTFAAGECVRFEQLTDTAVLNKLLGALSTEHATGL